MKKKKSETVTVTVVEHVTSFEIKLKKDLTDEEKRAAIFDFAKHLPSDGPMIIECSNSDLVD